MVVLSDSSYDKGRYSWKTVPGFAQTRYCRLSTAADNAYFPPGHPQAGTVYFESPVLPETFYPAADFHRLTFEHKFSEALRLLVGLGVREVVVEHVTGWAREFASSLSVP